MTDTSYLEDAIYSLQRRISDLEDMLYQQRRDLESHIYDLEHKLEDRINSIASQGGYYY